LWVGGAIKTVPKLGNVMNLVSLDRHGNFSQSTAKLLSPIARYVVASLFFTTSGAMVSISRDDRSNFAEFRLIESKKRKEKVVTRTQLWNESFCGWRNFSRS
jgi:hypothetical protein